jgi:hypothetical protein
MENHETETAPKRRLQKKSGIGVLLPIVLLLIFFGGGYFLFFSDSAQDLRPDTVVEQDSQNVIDAAPDNSPQQAVAQSEPAGTTTDTLSTVQDFTVASTPQIDTAAPADNALPALSVAASTTGGPPSVTAVQAPAVSEAELECTQLADNIDEFFTKLDNRDYMQPFEIGEKSSVYFPRLIQKLVDNPPVVSGETDDLFTILQNTAHFFRIIGKKNIFILKGILDRERDTFEQTLSDFYRLTSYPDCLNERFGLTIGKEPLYYYAGFFLNTMGGRLYLFRRDSMSRMVVSFYAILIIDQANREGRNEYGIEIKDAIDSLIEQLESSNIQLQMGDYYLDSLYEMKEKYQ